MAVSSSSGRNLAGLQGIVGVVRSNDDVEGPLIEFTEGAQVKLSQGERHRLIGLADFGVVAEILQHTGPVPSERMTLFDFRTTLSVLK